MAERDSDGGDGDGNDSDGDSPGDRVYQPAEDTRLLADAVVAAVGAGDRVLEVGCGSGWVAARVAETGADVVGADINPHACRATLDRGVPAVRADLVAPFRDGAFDAVAFNPPYLPDEPDAVPSPAADRPGTVPPDGDWMAVALSGGQTGREVVDRFLGDAGRVLAPGGAVFLLTSSLAGVDAVRDRATEAGFAAGTVAESSFPFETLVVLRLERLPESINQERKY